MVILCRGRGIRVKKWFANMEKEGSSHMLGKTLENFYRCMIKILCIYSNAIPSILHYLMSSLYPHSALLLSNCRLVCISVIQYCFVVFISYCYSINCGHLSCMIGLSLTEEYCLQVSIVHICEGTLTKRLIEFENTDSGCLTVSILWMISV